MTEEQNNENKESKTIDEPNNEPIESKKPPIDEVDNVEIEKVKPFIEEVDIAPVGDDVEKERIKKKIVSNQLEEYTEEKEKQKLKKEGEKKERKKRKKKPPNEDNHYYGYLLVSAFSFLLSIIFGTPLDDKEKKETEKLAIEYSERTGSPKNIYFLTTLILLAVLLPKVFYSLKNRTGLLGSILNYIDEKGQNADKKTS